MVVTTHDWSTSLSRLCVHKIRRRRSCSGDCSESVVTCAVLARSVDKEQEEEERQQLHRSWEMAAILDFLDLFRNDLKLDRSFTAHELESVLILSPGGEGLLGSVHTVRRCPLLLATLQLRSFMMH